MEIQHLSGVTVQLCTVGLPSPAELCLRHYSTAITLALLTHGSPRTAGFLQKVVLQVACSEHTPRQALWKKIVALMMIFF